MAEWQGRGGPARLRRIRASRGSVEAEAASLSGVGCPLARLIVNEVPLKEAEAGNERPCSESLQPQAF